MKNLRRLVLVAVLTVGVGACSTSITGPHNPDSGHHNPDSGHHNPDSGHNNSGSGT